MQNPMPAAKQDKIWKRTGMMSRPRRPTAKRVTGSLAFLLHTLTASISDRQDRHYLQTDPLQRTAVSLSHGNKAGFQSPCHRPTLPSSSPPKALQTYPPQRCPALKIAITAEVRGTPLAQPGVEGDKICEILPYWRRLEPRPIRR